MRCAASDEIELRGIGKFTRCLDFTSTGKTTSKKKKERIMKREKNCLEARLIKGKLRCVKYEAQDERPEIGDVAEAGLGFIDDFGYPGELNPAYGALAGGAAAVAGSIAAKMMNHKSSPHSKYSGLYGLAAGGVVAGTMMLFHSTRRAGYLAAAVAAIEAAGDLITTLYVEPKQLSGLGMYDTQVTGIGAGERIEILGDVDDIEGYGIGAGQGIEILGQSGAPALGASPMDVMGSLGLYQPESTMNGAFNPYGGTF